MGGVLADGRLRSHNRPMKFSLALAAALVAAMIGTEAANAGSVRQKQSYDVWRIEDDCAHAAFLKYPDYTPESNAKRDRATRLCEARNHLPPRQPVISSPVRTIPDDEAN